MHFVYGAANGNGREAARQYQARYPHRQQHDNRLFGRIHQRLAEVGSFHVDHHVGRPRNVDVDDEVLAIVEQNPSTSTRAIAAQVGMSQSAVWKVMNRIGLHPYHLQKVQGLVDGDYQRRVNFCHWVTQQTNREPDFLNKVLFTDEATFTRNGYFNCHNKHVWANANPHASFVNHNQTQFKINVWVGILGDNLIGPYLLPQNLNGHIYLTFLQETLPDLLEDVPIALRRRMWFQQDGTPAHFTRDVRAFLHNSFPGRWIGRHGAVEWPARSPDLSPLDYYLWGHLKSLVYETPVNDPETLVARLVAATLNSFLSCCFKY